MSALTKLDLWEIEKRIDEISETLDLCCPNRDADVIENLECELNAIMQVLETSEAINVEEEGL